ncbi:MAG: HEAT repeat domain-containing protein [Planctomycetota bacterium]
MKKLLVSSLLIAGGLYALAGSSSGHGGQYRGPGDTVPPGGGGGSGGGPSSPGPGGPGSPGPGGPGTPGPGAPAGSGGGPTTAGGGDSGPDLTLWSFWWEFNKEPYLNLKSHIHEGTVATGSDGFFIGRGQKNQGKNAFRPSAEQIRQKVVPALLAALETETNNDIVTGCLIALAKIGDEATEDGVSKFQEVFKSRLSDSNQEISETAAISLGILANDQAIPILKSLLFDEPEGRGMVKASEVKYRTRAFAAYGLGLIGARTQNEEKRGEIVQLLVDAISSEDTSSRDLAVACVISLGMVPMATILPPAGYEPAGKNEPPKVQCLTQQLDYLLAYLANKENRYLVRAHAPTALARLVQGLPTEVTGSAKSSLRDDYRERIAQALLDSLSKKADEKAEVVQSCILALGLLGDADSDQLDKSIRAALASVPKEISETQSRYFSLISMAYVGSNPGTGQGYEEGVREAHKYLAEQIAKGRGQVPHWSGLAVGVMGRRLKDKDLESGVVTSLAEGLRMALKTEKSGDLIGAYAIGSGILGDREAEGILQEKLLKTSEPEAQGYICVGLGLMGAREAIESIQKIVDESKFRAERLQQAAIALGLLGDKDLVPKLIEMLAESRGLATQAAISSALGFIGDQRSIDPLVEMLQNKDITESARGFAAVALGIVADKEMLPWNSKIAVDLNYRASTETLTSKDTGTGILDIL